METPVSITSEMSKIVYVKLYELGLRTLTGTTSGAGAAYPSGAPELDLVFIRFVLLKLSY